MILGRLVWFHRHVHLEAPQILFSDPVGFLLICGFGYLGLLGLLGLLHYQTTTPAMHMAALGIILG